MRKIRTGTVHGFLELAQSPQTRRVISGLATLALAASVGVGAGVLAAVFLRLLEGASSVLERHEWLLWLLPVGGAAIGWVYERFGSSVAAGNDLLLDRIHRRDLGVIPFRLAPLVLLATVATHLFGGSAGREGTAVQMGGAIASQIAHRLKMGHRARRTLLMSGISAGFGAVFGTPLAGAIFGLEVPSRNRLRGDALASCLVASVIGDATCRGLGIRHAVYPLGPIPPFTAILWLQIALAGAAFGAAAFLFTTLVHQAGALTRQFISSPLLRPAIGGALVIALTYAVHSRDYLGLSLPLLARVFDPLLAPAGVAPWAFALKLLFTVITLSAGFKGGEVTPLFVIGATLGAAIGHTTHQPVGFFAALGFVAVFAGAANTPLSCIVMGIELFGAPMTVPLTIVCLLARILSGSNSIYRGQR